MTWPWAFFVHSMDALRRRCYRLSVDCCACDEGKVLGILVTTSAVAVRIRCSLANSHS